ncbi:unnamed protein product, partial [Mesorhabditis belari]|uniref:FACT complex subunit n=1 Tax=Mesorhabditis belari TaxID=2138241 RepID=A0AAF3EV77_9BILA
MTTFGCRLESYCSNLSRTMLVDPSRELEGVYENVRLIQTAVIEALKPGRKLSEVYQIGIEACKRQDASLLDKLFSKEFGFSTGVEFRESRYTISPKCDEKVREGMVFIVQISVGDLKNPGVKDEQAKETQEFEQPEVKKAKNVSYKNYEKFPQDEEIDTLMIHVDHHHDSVILPLYGVPVPFHISMIKNCSTWIENDTMYLRINFAHPGGNVGKTSAPSDNLYNAFLLINEMRKKFKTKEAEEREKEGAVKQDKLIIAANQVNPKLKDLCVRPNIIAKRDSGTLEAHTNGFRYTALRGDEIDVLYNNIRHAFFQPCDNEMIILLHFHLKNPVLWGKKIYGDIQFFTEVEEITTNLGKYPHIQDRDAVASEQMKREMLNQTFQAFCDEVLKPTSSCLVNLTESPVFVVRLDDVERVHFERVSIQLKNFDLVFIFKDYHRKTQMIQQIPKASLDIVKEWLNSCDLKYTEGIQSLNWPKIMKTIVDDPVEFFETGGWSFLDPFSDDEDESDESDFLSWDEESYFDDSDSDPDSDENESEEETTESEENDPSLDSDESQAKAAEDEWDILKDKTKWKKFATVDKAKMRRREGEGRL